LQTKTIQIDPTNNQKDTIHNFDHSTFINEKIFLNDIFNIQPLSSFIICLIIFVLLICISVSILYRIPGIIASLFLLFFSPLILLIVILSNVAVSLSVLMGIFIGLCISFLIILYTMEKIKKYTIISNSLKIGSKKGFVVASQYIMDFFIFLLLCAVGFTFFGILDVQIFGITLLLIALI
jgi:hypothetical protein